MHGQKLQYTGLPAALRAVTIRHVGDQLTAQLTITPEVKSSGGNLITVIVVYICETPKSLSLTSSLHLQFSFSNSCKTGTLHLSWIWEGSQHCTVVKCAKQGVHSSALLLQPSTRSKLACKLDGSIRTTVNQDRVCI